MNNTIKKNLLSGVRVLDFSRVLLGAYCSMMLGDLGAEVIKVEPPFGDDTRKWGPPFIDKDSTYYLSVNRNKKSISLDLKNKQSHAIAKELITKSDILIENTVNNKMKDYGLDYESVQKSNPKLIYTSVSAFGDQGPLSPKPGFDLIMQAYTGLMNITGSPNGEPYKVGYPVNDILTGSHVHSAILSALLHRERTQEGQHISTSLLEVNLFAMMNITSAYLNGGLNSNRRGNDHPNISPYGIFKLNSGKYIALGVATELQFDRLATSVLNMEINESYNQKFKTNKLRITNREELRNIIQVHFSKIDDNSLVDLLNKYDIPNSLVNTMEDVFNQEHVKSIKLVDEVKTENYDKLKYIRHPINYSKLKCEDLKSPPLLGENTREVLKNLLNYSDERIDKLYADKVIY